MNQEHPERLPMELRELHDARCDAFEAAWNEGETPQLEQYVADVEGPGRELLLQDLCVVERHHLLQRDQPLDDEQWIALHPSLEDELAAVLLALEALEQSRARHESTLCIGPRQAGLHVRCPHCSNPVEFVAETRLDSLTCGTCGSAFQLVDGNETQVAEPVESIGRFRLIERLGMGGFGTVWRAHDSELDRDVALKLPRKGQLSPSEAEQFVREARSAAQLQHPHIVPVHEVGRHGDLIFIVSDLVRGEALSDWLTTRSPPVRELVELLVTIGDAVHHAHQQGVIHRDLKPGNIMIDRQGRPHVMDFGLAKREVGELTMTLAGQVLGTPSYMSPEQASGQSHVSDRRTDVYALGVVLFRLLTGELPYRGNAQTQMRLKLTEDAPDPRQLNRFVPRDLATLCVKCLERDPGRRLSSAAVLRDELQRWLDGKPIRSRPISRAARVVRWTRRAPALASAIFLTLFLAVAGPLTAVWAHLKRVEVEGLNRKNVNLLLQYKDEKATDRQQIAALTSQLDASAGTFDSWKTWPAEAAFAPREQQRARTRLLTAIASARSAGLQRSLRDDTVSDAERAQIHLALALLEESIDSSDQARDHYRQAAASLRRLQVDRPRVRRALAECYEQLARLYEAQENRAESQRYLEQAVQLFAADDNRPSNPQEVAKVVDWELRQASMAGSVNNAQHLARSNQAIQKLVSELPTETAELYRVISEIAGRAPHLAADAGE